jgi:hypothetical protein
LGGKNPPEKFSPKKLGPFYPPKNFSAKKLGSFWGWLPEKAMDAISSFSNLHPPHFRSENSP